jgi:DNA-binding response OmpR family regulator
LPTVLVVDAHRGFAAGLGLVLSGRGFAVRVAGTASEASAVVHDARPDLVVLDMELPDHSAFELCRELREIGPASGRPIVIATSPRATPDKVVAMALSADDYLTKPYAIDDLVDRINRHLGNRVLSPARSAGNDSTIFIEPSGQASISDFGSHSPNYGFNFTPRNGQNGTLRLAAFGEGSN